MKSALSILMIAALSGAATIPNVNSENSGHEVLSVLDNASLSPASEFQDSLPHSVIEGPVETLPAPMRVPNSSVQVPFAPGEQLILDNQQSIVHKPAGSDLCRVCCKTNCCCPRPTVFCLIDPSGCRHDACVDVPACCAGEPPVISWRGRLFGRQVATLCWECCDRKVKVVVTRRGKVRVRD